MTLSVAMMICGERRTGEKGLDATRSPAIARRSRDFVRRRPGQRVMTPFSRDRVDADEDWPADDDPTSDACAENDAEDALHRCRGPIDRFPPRQAVGLIA